MAIKYPNANQGGADRGPIQHPRAHGEASDDRPEVSAQRNDATQRPRSTTAARTDAPPARDDGRTESDSAMARPGGVGREGDTTRNRGGGLERSDEELQRSSESGVSPDARARRSEGGRGGQR